MKKLFLMVAQARSGGGGNASGSGRRGPETMSQFYRRTGGTRLGGNARTRGRTAPIRPVTRGRA